MSVTPDILRIAARIVDRKNDLSRYDAETLRSAAELLEQQKVSLLGLHATYGNPVLETALGDFIARDRECYRRQREEFESIRRRFVVAGVECMVFKSTGLYPSFHYLTSNLDVLVRPGHTGDARRCLVELGYVELLNIEEPQKFLFRRFPGDATSFAFHLHGTVGWGVQFLDNRPLWENARRAADDPDVVIPAPCEALLVTLAHWFYEDKALSLGSLFHTAHALRSLDTALAEPAVQARRRGWEDGFWGALVVFDESWKRLFDEPFLVGDRRAELDHAPARYKGVRARVLPRVRYLEDGVPATIPFNPNKLAYYRKILRDTQRDPMKKPLDIIDTLLWAVRWKLHIRSQRPLLVSVSGCDGSGKTLQVDRLGTAFETCDVRVSVVWARGASSRLAGALIRAGKTVLPERVPRTTDGIAANTATEAERFRQRRRRMRRPFTRWVFSMVYAIDLAWAYIFKTRGLLLTGNVVVCDRYVYDAFVDFALFAGTEASRPPRALRAVAALAPRPHVRILLDVESAEALRRKPEEGDTAHLDTARTMFLDLAKRYDQAVMPPAASAEDVQRSVAHLALDAFYGRYRTLINGLLRSNPGQINPRERSS